MPSSMLDQLKKSVESGIIVQDIEAKGSSLEYKKGVMVSLPLGRMKPINYICLYNIPNISL